MTNRFVTIDTKLQSCVTTTDVEQEWLKIKAVIQQTANEILGEAPRNSKDSWYDDKCREKAKERKESKAILNRQFTRARKIEYQKVSSETSRLFHIKKFVSQIEEASQNRNPKTMYRNIRQIKGGYRPRSNFVKNKAGDLLTSPQEIVEEWRSYYKQLLNDSEVSTEVEGVITSSENDDNIPTLTEIKDANSHLKRNKSPGEDGIPAEILHYGGSKLCQHMHELISEVWRQEKMTNEWSTSIIVSLHKKEDRTNCNNYRGLSMLNTAYKAFSRVLYKRLESCMNDLCGEYQAGYRKTVLQPITFSQYAKS